MAGILNMSEVLNREYVLVPLPTDLDLSFCRGEVKQKQQGKSGSSTANCCLLYDMRMPVESKRRLVGTKIAKYERKLLAQDEAKCCYFGQQKLNRFTKKLLADDVARRRIKRGADAKSIEVCVIL